MPKIPLIRLLLSYFLLLVGTLAAAAQATPAEQPNIVWITCEDISPFIGAYGATVVKTPNIDQLAREGLKYTRAYTAAGVCAPSRSSIITGMYPTSIGTQHMRTVSGNNGKFRPAGLPNYAAVIPEYVKCFPEYLRRLGYYTTNNEKQDYQFEPPVTVWDENGPAASYQNRPKGQPFFAVFNLFTTHESQLFLRKDSLQIDPAQVNVPAYYPDTKVVRRDIARLLTNIQLMDGQVGELVQQLKADGLYDNTVIFFYSDHGGALPWMKREVLERGIHIPLIVRLPGGRAAGTENHDLVSAVDFAPTVLSLAGVPVPGYMQGQAFLGPQKAAKPRTYIFAARDRMDEKTDRVRAVHDARYEYLYNYLPALPHYQDLGFRKSVPMMREILALRDAGQLSATQLAWFTAPKPQEELYDIQADPEQLHNLAADPKHQAKLTELRTAFRTWEKKVGDMSAVSENEMVATWWHGQPQAPGTALPQFTPAPQGVRISCATPGTSIGYRVVKAGQPDQPASRTVHSWDAAWVAGTIQNGTTVPAAPVWQVYAGQPIKLQPGDKLLVNALRIGYAPATAEYVR